MLLSVGTCLVFIASTEHKIGLLPSMVIHISVTTCDACAVDHVVRFTGPSPSAFAYCKQSKTGGWEGLGMRLRPPPPLQRKAWYLFSCEHDVIGKSYKFAEQQRQCFACCLFNQLYIQCLGCVEYLPSTRWIYVICCSLPLGLSAVLRSWICPCAIKSILP